MKRHDIFYLFSPTLFLAGLKKDLNILGNDLVTHIWADDEHLVRCFNDKQCIQNDQNPDGMYVNLVSKAPTSQLSLLSVLLGSSLHSLSGAASHTITDGVAVRIHGR